ncbi:MAG: hypothetical protein LBG92_04085 [Prevotellaceae bacterium]|jgi:phenylalanyl-tRNA synthetase alpha subunit|nr:hypothetical protein [Prevotellaceae bacterium]
MKKIFNFIKIVFFCIAIVFSADKMFLYRLTESYAVERTGETKVSAQKTLNKKEKIHFATVNVIKNKIQKLIANSKCRMVVPETENRTDVKHFNNKQTGREKFSGTNRKTSAPP